ncbi:MAG: hypothetical protein RR191_05275 [Cetobacterium sp.]|uniref:hypothetical protein n=1 Tax=unclassified Cetobacterium TaxID=2630983 RepID=UPI00163CA37B|nr:hypothetical protein [Cetobacterium sp. 2A]MBC2856412.1 hypothetical protein [Cetobacterium sp. 2A]
MKKLLTLFMIISATIFAEIKTELVAQKVVTSSEGKIERVSAENANPGDIINYSFFMTNEDNETATNLNPTIPIPMGTSLIPDTISPKDFKVTINGRDFYDFPIKVDGKDVPNSEYRVVSWSIPELKAKGEKKVELSVQIHTVNKN